MPTYRYRCADCGNEFDQFQKFSEDPLTVCPSCEGRVRRVIQPVGVVFKGSGWYITDSRPSSNAKSDGNGKSDKAESSEKSEAKSTAAETAAVETSADSSKSSDKPKPAEKKAAASA